MSSGSTECEHTFWGGDTGGDYGAVSSQKAAHLAVVWSASWFPQLADLDSPCESGIAQAVTAGG